MRPLQLKPHLAESQLVLVGALAPIRHREKLLQQQLPSANLEFLNQHFNAGQRCKLKNKIRWLLRRAPEVNLALSFTKSRRNRSLLEVTKGLLAIVGE